MFTSQVCSKSDVLSQARCVFTSQVCVHKSGVCSQVRYEVLFAIGYNVDKSGMYVLFAIGYNVDKSGMKCCLP